MGTDEVIRGSGGRENEVRGNNGQDRLDSRDGIRGNDVLQGGRARIPAGPTGGRQEELLEIPRV